MSQLKSGDFSDLWNKIIRLLGIRITEGEKTAYIKHLQELTAYMQSDYPNVTAQTVELAYRLGVKELLTKPNGEPFEMFAELNPRSIGKVLAAFERFRKKQMLGFIAPGQEPKEVLALPPSQQELDRANVALFCRAYAVHQAGGCYTDHGNALYDWLDSKELIPFSNERKWEFMMKAQDAIRLENVGKMYGVEMRHKDARFMAEVLKQALSANQIYLPLEAQIRTKAKHLAFTTLLNDLIEFETTPEIFLASLSQ